MEFLVVNSNGFCFGVFPIIGFVAVAVAVDELEPEPDETGADGNTNAGGLETGELVLNPKFVGFVAEFVDDLVVVVKLEPKVNSRGFVCPIGAVDPFQLLTLTLTLLLFIVLVVALGIPNEFENCEEEDDDDNDDGDGDGDDEEE